MSQPERRWTYRSVEGALYSLGRPVGVQPPVALPLREPARPRQPAAASGVGVAPTMDLATSLRRSLDKDELEVVRQHYILGARPFSGREGYQRRERIIKKLVSSLNEEPAQVGLTDEDGVG